MVKIDLVKLRELVAEQPDATIRELHQRLGVQCSESAVVMALKRLDLTFKKRRCMLRSRIERTFWKSAPSGRWTSPTVQPPT